jgi:hypothetical protein
MYRGGFILANATHGGVTKQARVNGGGDFNPPNSVHLNGAWAWHQSHVNGRAALEKKVQKNTSRCIDVGSTEGQDADCTTSADAAGLPEPSSMHRLAQQRRYVSLKLTNLRVKGLSLNRSQKRSALLSTTPRLRTRSSTNDLAPLRRMW